MDITKLSCNVFEFYFWILLKHSCLSYPSSLWRTCQLNSNIKTAVMITKSKYCQSFRPKFLIPRLNASYKVGGVYSSGYKKTLSSVNYQYFH